MPDEISHIEDAIRDRLAALCDEFRGELEKLFEAYQGVSDETKTSPFYTTLGDRISSVEALFNTLVNTAESFPAPAKQAMQ